MPETVKTAQTAKPVNVEALVTFAIDNSVHLRSSTKSGLQENNVLGQQFFYLYPGSTGPDIRAGHVIPLSQSISDPGVGAFLNALGPFLSAINPAQADRKSTRLNSSHL